ncbi:MAG: hypothetical protein DSY35_01700 [Desulfurobacterium sp.]|nr:MAG: hypothetical protein DSY35_01700 [Desulfurobacterium sp.]
MIKKLPQDVVLKIASGQIASSPSAVLKELIENSLDAGATEITVKVNDPFNFRVVDNGSGIPYKELPLAVERFATSKIEKVEDLERIRTYGFRGEALHAISQVSHLKIKSRHREETLGGKIEVKGGKVISLSPIPFSGGTSVTVSSLFFNTPVRRKAFNGREKKKLFQTVKTFALCHPEVTFRVNEETFPATSLKERIVQVFGDSVHFNYVESERVKLLFTTANEEERKRVSYIFVNKRPVSVPDLERLLEELRVKNYILFIDLPPKELDVNVVPSKERIFIKDKSVNEEIRELLERKVSLPTVSFVKEKREIEYRTPLKLLGTDGTVIIACDNDYYYFFDQHLVHERVNYEELLKELKEGNFRHRQLIPPLELKVPEEVVKKLKELHVRFEVSREGIRILSIPEILEVEDLKNIAKEKPLESIAETACRRALKAGYLPLNLSDVEELFNRFLRCSEREVCPHGRPIYYRIKKEKIFRKLHRK